MTTTTIGEILESQLQVSLARPLTYETCSDCGEQFDRGLAGRCTRCNRKRMFAALPERNKEESYRTLVHERYINARLSDIAEPLVKKMEALKNGEGILFWGAPGVGKTYAMAALAIHYLLDGHIVCRVNYEMLCLTIRDTFKTQSRDTELAMIQPMLDADKLFIEDIGTTKSEKNVESDFSVRVLLVILDHRNERLLPTFFTTNRTVEEIGRTFDQRIASRIHQACEIIKLDGKDRRER